MKERDECNHQYSYSQGLHPVLWWLHCSPVFWEAVVDETVWMRTRVQVAEIRFWSWPNLCLNHMLEPITSTTWWWRQVYPSHPWGASQYGCSVCSADYLPHIWMACPVTCCEQFTIHFEGRIACLCSDLDATVWITLLYFFLSSLRPIHLFILFLLLNYVYISPRSMSYLHGSMAIWTLVSKELVQCFNHYITPAFISLSFHPLILFALVFVTEIVFRFIKGFIITQYYQHSHMLSCYVDFLSMSLKDQLHLWWYF